MTHRASTAKKCQTRTCRCRHPFHLCALPCPCPQPQARAARQAAQAASPEAMRLDGEQWDALGKRLGRLEVAVEAAGQVRAVGSAVLPPGQARGGGWVSHPCLVVGDVRCPLFGSPES